MFSFFEFVFILRALLFCLHVCLCENAELPELQLQTVVNCRVGAGNCTWVLQKSSSQS